jgi:hypothetical protein
MEAPKGATRMRRRSGAGTSIPIVFEPDQFLVPREVEGGR